MDGVDVTVLALLALGDICLLVQLRRRRARRLRIERMYYRLALAVRRELAALELSRRQRKAALAGRGLLRPVSAN
jgi:hypothetical protein